MGYEAKVKTTLPCGARFDGPETEFEKFQEKHEKCKPGKCSVKD